MFCKENALDGGVFLKYGGDRFGEIEARHHIGNISKAPAEQLLTQSISLRLVGKRENGRCVCVIDEPVRQKSVQQRFDGWVRRCRIKKAGPQKINHILVGKSRKRARAPQLREVERGKAGRLDRSKVPSAALDTDNLALAP